MAYKLPDLRQVSPNGGSFRPLDVQGAGPVRFSRPRSLPPAGGISHRWACSSICLIKALSPVLPDKTAGAHYGDSMVITLARLGSAQQ